jgi:putative MATE family efflux protein
MAIGPLLLRMAIPATAAMMTNALYNVVDTIFLGRWVGPHAIGALSITFPIQIILLSLGLLSGVGGASIVSRALGSGDPVSAGRATGNALLLSAISSGLVIVFGLLFMDEVLTLFGATSTLLPYAREYLVWVLPGGIFISLSITASHLLRAEGLARAAMLVTMIGALANIILDPIFIYVLDMGIRGAAIATVIAKGLSFSFVLWFFYSGRSNLHPDLQAILPRWSVLVEIVKIGLAAFVRQAGASIFVITANNALGYYGGDSAISVFGIINRVLIFVVMPLVGIAHGFQPIVGFNFGAGNHKRVLDVVRVANIACATVAGFFFVIIMIFPGAIISVFTTSRELQTLGRPAMRTVLLVIPLLGMQITGTVFFQAVGKAGPALVLSMSRQIILLIPFILVLPIFLGLSGVWIAFPAADVISTTITILWLRHSLRQLRLVQ